MDTGTEPRARSYDTRYKRDVHKVFSEHPEKKALSVLLVGGGYDKSALFL